MVSYSTTYVHYKIYHLASYLGQPLTVGSGSRNPYHAKNEIMDIETGQWKTGQPYPFGKR